jgi:uncharacterized protein YegP (UPF0339 family)
MPGHPSRRSLLVALGGAIPLFRSTAVKAFQVAPPHLRFEMLSDSRQEFRWHLKGANGRIIASSGEGYKKKAACRAAIGLIQRGAADAPIDDRTEG